MKKSELKQLIKEVYNSLNESKSCSCGCNTCGDKKILKENLKTTELQDELLDLADGLTEKYPNLKDKITNIMYNTVDVENLRHSSEKDIRLAIKQLNSLKPKSIKEEVKPFPDGATNPDGFPLEGKINFQGLNIMVENDKGSVRKGINEDGTPWETEMIYPYGYISDTKAADNEHVDCYVGDNHESDRVFIVHQVFPETGEYDEDKVMLGFDEPEEAKQAYLDHYDSPDFFGSMTEMKFDEFKEKLKTKKGKKLNEQKMEKEFNYAEYLRNNPLLKESNGEDQVIDQLKSDMSSLINGLDLELEKASEKEQPTNEGLLTIASIAIALPAILGLIARVGKKAGAVIGKIIGKKPASPEDEAGWFEKLGHIADELHHLYLVPIEKIVGKFVKDHDKAKKISNVIFHVIVASFLIASGVTTAKALQAKNLSLATLEGALTAIKSGEISTFIKSALNS